MRWLPSRILRPENREPASICCQRVLPSTIVLTFGPGHKQIAAIVSAGFKDSIGCGE